MKESKKQEIYSAVENALRSSVGYCAKGHKSGVIRFDVEITSYPTDVYQTYHDSMIESILGKVKELLEDPRNPQLRRETEDAFTQLYNSLEHIKENPFRVKKRFGRGFEWVDRIGYDVGDYEKFYGIRSQEVLEAHQTLRDGIALLSTDSLKSLARASALTSVAAVIFGAGYWTGKETRKPDASFTERVNQEQVEPAQGR